MQEKLVSEKKKYNKKNNFRINIFFNENGEFNFEIHFEFENQKEI